VRVLRVYHSSVVTGWRERDRLLRAAGVDVTLVSPTRWNEGGADVTLTDPEPWVVVTRSLGRHPYVFVLDPRPIIRLLRTNRYDLIDVHEEPASLIALELRVLSWIHHRRTPMLFYGAQNLEKRFPIPFRWIERASLRRARATYPCNREAGEIYRRKGFRGIVRVLPLGVEVERFSASAVRRATTPFRLGYVGRLEEHKGVQVVLDALVELDDVVLDICGDGDHRAELVAQVRDRGLGRRVTFHGFTPHDELAERYRSFDAVVIPSQTRPNWVEQYGRVAVEAMASGIPVLASSSGALPDVVGDAGILLPEADVGAWRTAIRSLASSPERRDLLRRAGLARAIASSWHAVAEAHAALYATVCGISSLSAEDCVRTVIR
jgi:glycosyltransferase involved in cell wall biosynthesis